ncbi:MULTISPECIES: mannosyltransferase family protein [unclassified Streptomyces]|uniref:mannosyltransferase family protein n=1 Tax=unclassified Streptomyces TaxID=2593676 RepID=UPI0036E28686
MPVLQRRRAEPESPARPRPGSGRRKRPWWESWAGRLRPMDRQVLWLYLLTRIGVWVTACSTRWLFPSDEDTRDPGPLLAPFEQWDWHHYARIAQDGYFPGLDGPWQKDWDNREAFFPGFPLLLRGVHLVVAHWTSAGLLISLVAGAVAVVSLARIAQRSLPGQDAGRRTVMLLLLSPCAIFLAVGYTEAVFLALALPAWLAAERRNWALAALLTTLATSVRISGLFLAAAIAVQFLLTARRRGDWASAPWLVLPALPVLVFSWFLEAHTGDWMAWQKAQARGWYRDFHTPWDAWGNTWNGAFDHTYGTGYAFMLQAELVAMLVGLFLVGLLIRRRRWAEAVYVGLSLWALGTSYWYMSVPRATLLWWPLWIAVAAASLRRPQICTLCLCVVAPLSTVFAVTFFSGRWAG